MPITNSLTDIETIKTYYARIKLKKERQYFADIVDDQPSDNDNPSSPSSSGSMHEMSLNSRKEIHEYQKDQKQVGSKNYYQMSNHEAVVLRGEIQLTMRNIALMRYRLLFHPLSNLRGVFTSRHFDALRDAKLVPKILKELDQNGVPAQRLFERGLQFVYAVGLPENMLHSSRFFRKAASLNHADAKLMLQIVKLIITNTYDIDQLLALEKTGNESAKLTLAMLPERPGTPGLDHSAFSHLAQRRRCYDLFKQGMQWMAGPLARCIERDFGPYESATASSKELLRELYTTAAMAGDVTVADRCYTLTEENNWLALKGSLKYTYDSPFKWAVEPTKSQVLSTEKHQLLLDSIEACYPSVLATIDCKEHERFCTYYAVQRTNTDTIGLHRPNLPDAKRSVRMSCRKMGGPG